MNLHKIMLRDKEANINGEELGGDDSEGDDKGGKGDGGRGYKDDGNNGDDGGDGGDGGNDDAKWGHRQQGWHLAPSTMQGHYSQEQEFRETRPTADQSRWHVTHVFPPLLGWLQASQARSVLGKTEGMMDGCTGGGEVALRITGVQTMKKEKVKISPVDGADT